METMLEQKEAQLVEFKLRVVHYPNIAYKKEPYIQEVSNEFEAKVVLDTLANQHLYLLENGFIIDYSNLIYIEMFHHDDNEWIDYYNDFENMDWEEFSEEYL